MTEVVIEQHRCRRLCLIRLGRLARFVRLHYASEQCRA
jgi:hypothetical protein